MTTGADGRASELRIDLGAITANWRLLQGRHAGAVAAVLKADAYGHGAAQVAPALLAAGCRHFFVAHLDEALAIRALLPGALLAVLNGLWPGTEGAYVQHDIRPVLGSLAEIDAWAGTARRAGRALPALLHADTGMNRLGLTPAEAVALALDPARLDGVAVEYVMTHLVSAELPEDPANQAQRERFAAVCAGLPAGAAEPGQLLGPVPGPGFRLRPGAPGRRAVRREPDPRTAQPHARRGEPACAYPAGA